MWTGAASGTGLGARPPGIGMRAGWQLWCKKCILLGSYAPDQQGALPNRLQRASRPTPACSPGRLPYPPHSRPFPLPSRCWLSSRRCGGRASTRHAGGTPPAAARWTTCGRGPTCSACRARWKGRLPGRVWDTRRRAVEQGCTAWYACASWVHVTPAAHLAGACSFDLYTASAPRPCLPVGHAAPPGQSQLHSCLNCPALTLNPTPTPNIVGVAEILR